MLNLRRRIQDLPGGNPLVIDSRRAWSARDLLENLDGEGDAYKGWRVAIQTSDPARLLRILIQMDGVAESMLLIPSSCPPPLVSELMRKSGSSILMRDAHEAPPPYAPLVPVENTQESPPPTLTELEDSRETRWILATSGTTGTPKLVAHTLASLTRTIRMPKPGIVAVWGLLYDHARFAGLQVLLQSVLSGSTLVCTSPEDSMESKLALLAARGCTHLSATPTMWRRIAMSSDAGSLDLEQVTLGGEISDAKILSILSETFPRARISHIFASTEAGVGFSVTDRKPGFPQSWIDQPPDGVELAVRDGRLFLRSSEAVPGYVGTDQRLATETGWIDSGDSVAFDAGRVIFLGRANGVINVGGDKVHPEEIEALMTSHPEVVAARAYAKPNPITGSLVVVEITLLDPASDKDRIGCELRRLAETSLERHKIPAGIRFSASVPPSESGKIDRR